MTATVLNRFEQTTGKDNALILDGTVKRHGLPLPGISGGEHTVTASEESGGTVSIDTGFTSISSVIVQIIRSDAVVTGDAVVGNDGTNINIASGASTYTVTEGDLINYIALGA